MPSAETQKQSEAADPLHDSTAFGVGAEIPAKTVPEHRRTRGIFRLPESHGDSSQNLVSGMKLSCKELTKKFLDFN